MSPALTSMIDAQTARAAQVFLNRIRSLYAVDHAILFGSRARMDHREDSDADIAVVMLEDFAERADIAIAMAGIAFDVLLDTGVLIQALPLRKDEFEHPEHFANPGLIDNIRREGMTL